MSTNPDLPNQSEMANGGSVQRLVSQPDRHSKNGSDTDCMARTSQDEYPYKKTTLGGGADVSLSLLQLLDVLSCPKVGKSEIEWMARTSTERHEIEALVSLWQSLGRPTSVFWRECRVFRNRMVDSYGEMANEKVSHRPTDADK